jgi:DNA-binding FadR family transcriptional regulator
LKLLEMRMPIETEIAALAALRRTDHDLERLGANFEAQRANRELDASAQLDVEFHALLAEATHNEMFQLLLESLAEVLFDTRRRAWELSTHENVIRRHGEILSAVAARDSKKAAVAMRRHLDIAWGEALRGAARQEDFDGA